MVALFPITHTQQKYFPSLSIQAYKKFSFCEFFSMFDSHISFHWTPLEIALARERGSLLLLSLFLWNTDLEISFTFQPPWLPYSLAPTPTLPIHSFFNYILLKLNAPFSITFENILFKGCVVYRAQYMFCK